MTPDFCLEVGGFSCCWFHILLCLLQSSFSPLESYNQARLYPKPSRFSFPLVLIRRPLNIKVAHDLR